MKEYLLAKEPQAITEPSSSIGRGKRRRIEKRSHIVESSHPNNGTIYKGGRPFYLTNTPDIRLSQTWAQE
jgi:hypothetical protein